MWKQWKLTSFGKCSLIKKNRPINFFDFLLVWQQLFYMDWLFCQGVPTYSLYRNCHEETIKILMLGVRHPNVCPLIKPETRTRSRATWPTSIYPWQSLTALKISVGGKKEHHVIIMTSVASGVSHLSLCSRANRVQNLIMWKSLLICQMMVAVPRSGFNHKYDFPSKLSLFWGLTDSSE